MRVEFNTDGMMFIIANEYDDCRTCQHALDIKCPLFLALIDEIIIPKFENILITNCPLYKQEEASSNKEQEED